MNTMNSYIKKEVALLGANTTFGKITSFLLKQSPLLSKLTLYDDKSLKTLDDIKYINSPCKISFFNGREHMGEAIQNADIVIIGDDNPKTMSHEATLMSRAPFFSNCIRQIADNNSDAIIVVATNPVNMTVPLAAEVLRNLGKLDEKKLIGMSNVENLKARSILAHHLQICPGTIDVPVVGGLTAETSVPLLSYMNPRIPLSKANLQKVTCAIKTSGNKLHYAEGSQESSNRAYATAKLVKSIVTALNGCPTMETVLSYQSEIKCTDYFSLPVLLGENGIMNHVSFPNISQHEKYLLSHAAACMAAESNKAKDCYAKLTNCVGKPISVPKSKLNKLKPPKIQNKQQKPQYVSTRAFQPNRPKRTYLSDIKFKSNMDYIASTTYFCNKNIKKSTNKNKLKNLNLIQSQTQCNAEHKEPSDNDLKDSFNSLHVTKDQSKSSTVETENIDQFTNLVSQSDTCTDDSFKQSTKTTNLESDEQLPVEARNKTEMPGNNSSWTLDKKKIVPESEKTIDEESGLSKLKIEVLTMPKNIANLNTNEDTTSIDPIVNFINTELKNLSSPHQLHEPKKWVKEEDKSPVECKNTAKQLATPENVSIDIQKNSFTSENLEKIFTSNIVRMVNDTQNRKRGLIGSSTSEAINCSSECKTGIDKHLELFKMRTKIDDKNQDVNKPDREIICDTSFKAFNDIKTSGKKCSLQTNQPHWILQSMLFKSERHQSSKRPILSRYVSSESCDNKITKKFSDANSKKDIRQVASLAKSQTSINKSLESLLSRFVPSESQDKKIIKKEYINLKCRNKKKKMNSLSNFNTNTKEPRDVFLSRCTSSKSNYKEIVNEESNEIKQGAFQLKVQTDLNKKESFWSCDSSSETNAGEMKKGEYKVFATEEKVRQANLVPKCQTNINKTHESRSCVESPESEDGKQKNKEFEASNSEKEVRQVNLTPTYQITINKPHQSLCSRNVLSDSLDVAMKNKKNDTRNPKKEAKQVNLISKYQTNNGIPHESISVTLEQESYNSPPLAPKFRTAKYQDWHRKLNLTFKKPSNTGFFENLLQKQRNSISSGHKIASFRAEGSEDSFFVLLRKKINFDMLDKAIHRKSNRSDFQKLHLLTIHSKERVTNHKVIENKIKSSYVKDRQWKNKQLKKGKEHFITEQQTSETTMKNTDIVQHQCTSGDKSSNCSVKEGEQDSKDEIENNSKKSFNIDTFNVSNNQVMRTPYKNKQKEKVLDHNDLPTSEAIMSNDHHLSNSNGNGLHENKEDPNIASKYNQQRPILDCEANSINTEEIKSEEKFIKPKPSKESEEDTK